MDREYVAIVWENYWQRKTKTQRNSPHDVIHIVCLWTGLRMIRFKCIWCVYRFYENNSFLLIY